MGAGSRGVKLTTCLHLVSRLRMSGAVPRRLLYIFMMYTGTTSPSTFYPSLKRYSLSPVCMLLLLSFSLTEVLKVLYSLWVTGQNFACLVSSHLHIAAACRTCCSCDGNNAVCAEYTLWSLWHYVVHPSVASVNLTQNVTFCPLFRHPAFLISLNSQTGFIKHYSVSELLTVFKKRTRPSGEGTYSCQLLPREWAVPSLHVWTHINAFVGPKSVVLSDAAQFVPVSDPNP
jgi:hypothetical protein